MMYFGGRLHYCEPARKPWRESKKRAVGQIQARRFWPGLRLNISTCSNRPSACQYFLNLSRTSADSISSIIGNTPGIECVREDRCTKLMGVPISSSLWSIAADADWVLVTHGKATEMNAIGIPIAPQGRHWHYRKETTYSRWLYGLVCLVIKN